MKRFTLITLVALAACDTDSGPQGSLGTRVRTSPALRTFESCDTLAERLRDATKEQMRVELLQYEESYSRWYGGVDDGAEEAPQAGADNDSAGGNGAGGREEGVDFSGTNNQEAGVDEADFVKTDGYAIYVLSGDKLVTLAVPEFGELVPKSEVAIEGYPTSMLLADGKVSVFSSVYANAEGTDPVLRAEALNDDNVYAYSSFTKITVLDMSDLTTPHVEREVYIEGWFSAAREIDDTVRLVSYSYRNIAGLISYPNLPNDYWSRDNDDEERQAILHAAVASAIAHNDEVLSNAPISAFVPSIHWRDNGGDLQTQGFAGTTCNNFAMADDAVSHGVTSILSLNLGADDFGFEADHIVSNWGAVYASLDTLVIAEPAQDWWWYWSNDSYDEAVNVHRFDIGTPGVTRYTGSGRVAGSVWDPFQISEKDGFIRIAATTGTWNRWWQQDPVPATNNVYVLAGVDSLVEVGHVGGIAPDERLWSSRFVGDKAYLVTFQNVDPLWVVDLSNPYAPVVQGEVEVPGVSTYIHPLEGGHLLTIGYGGDGFGLDWSAQISLFDVSNPTQPVLQQTYPLAVPAGSGWQYSWSEATYEHKAFQFWPALNLLAVPASTYRYEYVGCDAAPSDVDCYGYTYEYDSKLELIKVDAAGTTDAQALSHYGAIRHSDFYNDNPWYFWSFRDVRRSIFMGDYIYAISDRAVTAHLTSTLEQTASAPLPGSYSSYYGGGMVD